MTTQPMTPSPHEGTIQLDAGQQPLTGDRCSEKSTEQEHAWYLPCKAAVDFVIAFLLLMLTGPLILLTGLLVRLTSRGPAFYSQIRLGKDGREFAIYKLRTMIDNAETLTGPVWAEADDDRVTPLGRFLRKTHIDELPQLVNVLLGQMSLVGPRPERPELVPQLEWELPQYRDRLQVRPGMTGLAQLRLPPDYELESVRRKLVYDLYYVQYASPWLDIRIVFFTSILLLVDVLRTAWGLVALPSWEVVKRHVPPGVSSNIDGGVSVVADSRAGNGDRRSDHTFRAHREVRKAR